METEINKHSRCEVTCKSTFLGELVFLVVTIMIDHSHANVRSVRRSAVL